MPIDPNGSRPETFAPGGLEFEQQNFTSREVEPSGPKANDWRPKKKIGLPDQRKICQAYREGWDRIFGQKETA